MNLKHGINNILRERFKVRCHFLNTLFFFFGFNWFGVSRNFQKPQQSAGEFICRDQKSALV